MFIARRKGKNRKYHLYDGEDTACKMYSTGGLVHKNYTEIIEVSGLKLCHMCFINAKKDDDKWILQSK